MAISRNCKKIQLYYINMPEEKQYETPRILVVEDDPFLSSLLKNRLEREGGFDIRLVMKGGEVVSAIEDFKPHLMLLDVILPEKTGFEILEDMKTLPMERPPVIILSNLGQDIDIARGKELGVIDYFVKAKTPIDDLIQKIQGLFVRE